MRSFFFKFGGGGGVTVGGGSGTTNALAKFTGASELDDSQISDDGTYLNINKAGQTTGKLAVKSSADNKNAIIAEANSSSATGSSGSPLVARAEDTNFLIQNTAASQNVGYIGRDSSAGITIEASLADLTLQGGGAAGDIVLRTLNAAKVVNLKPNNADGIRVDNNAVAGNTRLLLYDVDNGTLERVSVGAADSGGAGFKVLRIPN